MRRDGTVLGFDVGKRRIGVAVGSAVSGGARPIAVVDVHDGAIDWAKVDKLIREWMPDGLVVGDPLTLAGDDQPIRKFAQQFARDVAARSKRAVVMMDERSSSVEAAGAFAARRAAGASRRRDAEVLDAMAAAIIVERWIASPDDAVPVPGVTT